MAFVFPSQVTLNAAGKNWLLAIKQGEAVMETIWVSDSPKYYRLDRKTKTYSTIPLGGRSVSDSLQQVAEKTKETMNIQGYTCNKYVVHLNKADTSMQQVYWVTTAIDVKGMESLRGHSGDPVFFKNMQEMPLRVEINSATMNLVITTTQILKGPTVRRQCFDTRRF